MAQVAFDHCAHLSDLFLGRAAIRLPNHGGPHTVKSDVGANIDSEAGRSGERELLRDVVTTNAIGIQNLGSDTFSEHLFPRRSRRPTRTAVNVNPGISA